MTSSIITAAMLVLIGLLGLEIPQTYCRIQHHDSRATEESGHQTAQDIHVPCILRHGNCHPACVSPPSAFHQ